MCSLAFYSSVHTSADICIHAFIIEFLCDTERRGAELLIVDTRNYQ